MMNDELYDLVQRTGELLKSRSLTVVTAESCTGGAIGAALTMVGGSSAWYERGFVTYTSASKREVLDVTRKTLSEHGAVSEQTVKEMVLGALAHSRAQLAVAVSGVAGPAGGTPEKPVGTVCIAWGLKNGELRAETCHFAGDREAVRDSTVARALVGITELLRD